MSRYPIVIVTTRTVTEQRIRAVKLTLLITAGVLAFAIAVIAPSPWR